MKKIFKNMLKTIASVCLVLQLSATLVFGIYKVSSNIWYKQNEESITQEFVEAGKKYREDINEENQEQKDKELGMYLLYVPMFIKFEMFSTSALLLIASIIIGSIIGIANSIDENSKKKVITTYIVMYLVILITICLFEMLSYGGFSISNFFGIAVELFIAYTIIYFVTLLNKRIDNSRKVKVMNEDLKK